jgi:hypothetical protein
MGVPDAIVLGLSILAQTPGKKKAVATAENVPPDVRPFVSPWQEAAEG